MDVSKELKIYELSLIWSEAKYNFAFWDKLSNLDWDKEYYKAIPAVLKTKNLYEYYLELMKFIALLNDGHTDVWFPKTLKNDCEYFSELPIYTKLIKGQRVITSVKNSVKDIIKRFSVIKKINGIETNEYIKKYIYPYIWHALENSADYLTNLFLIRGKENSVVELELEYNCEAYIVNLKRVKDNLPWVYQENLKSEDMKEVYSSSTHNIKTTKDNIAVITIDSMNSYDLPDHFYSNLPMLEKVDGYIIDIRNNSGGNSTNSDAVAGTFLKDSFINQKALHPIHIGVYKAWNVNQDFGNQTYEEVVSKRGSFDWLEKTYKIPRHLYFEECISRREKDKYSGTLLKPLVVLTSSNTASAAEDFLVELDYNKRITIVGSPSFGSTGMPLTIDLESGGGFRICTRHCMYPNGKEFINVGVLPHIQHELSVEDYQLEVDSVMNKGLEVLRKMLKND